MPNLSPKVRNGIYVTLVLLNAVLAVASEQSIIPSAYAHFVALGSLLVTGLMKQFGAPEVPVAAPADPVSVPVSPPPGVN